MLMVRPLQGLSMMVPDHVFGILGAAHLGWPILLMNSWMLSVSSCIVTLPLSVACGAGRLMEISIHREEFSCPDISGPHIL